MYRRIVSQSRILHRLQPSKKILPTPQQWRWRYYTNNSNNSGHPYLADLYQKFIQHPDNGVMACNFANDVLDYWGTLPDDRVAIQYIGQMTQEKSRISYKELIRCSHQIAYALLDEQGLKKGDPVGLLLGQHPVWHYGLWAAMRAGLPVVLLPQLLSPSDLTYRINDLGVKAVIAQFELHHKIDEVRHNCPLLNCLMSTGIVSPPWRSLDKILPQQKVVKRQPTTTQDTSIFLNTSGTTGRPKGAKHTATYPFNHYLTGTDWMQLTPTDRLYNASDPGWGFTVWSAFASASTGVEILVSPTDKDFNAKKMLDLLCDQEVTVFCAAPTVLRRLVADPSFKYYDFPKLKRIISVGEALDETVIEAFAEKGVETRVGFGQAETGGRIIGHAANEPHVPNTMGKEVPPFKIVLLDEKMKPVGANQPGQIAVVLDDSPRRGIMLEYYNAPDRTEQVFVESEDGHQYYLTGDWAMQREDGYFICLGRGVDMLKRSDGVYDYRIGPDEVEKPGMSHPAVAKIAAIEIPRRDSGDKMIKVFVLLTPDCQGKTDQEKLELAASIQAHIAKEAGSYKCPDEVEFLSLKEWSEYETTSGKIRRVALRQRELDKRVVENHALSQNYRVGSVSVPQQKIEPTPPSSTLRPGG